MNKLLIATGLAATAIAALLIITAYTAIAGTKREEMVEYIGAQRDIFTSGKASGVVSLEDLATRRGLYAMGPVEGLDGEITIFDSKPYITKVRGREFIMDNTLKHGAFFLVWTEQAAWKDVPVPASVRGYADLQRFVREQAQAAGIDTGRPFPFLLAGAPVEIKWHINVDRTGGKPITKELFSRSKEHFVMRSEPVDIVGFYSESHAGVFLSQYAPSVKEGSGMRNAIHVHLVSRSGKAAGHIDDLTLGEGMVLRLPRP